MLDFAEARVKMVDGQLRTSEVTSHRVLEAMLAVPREAFVPAPRRGLAYVDCDLLLQEGNGAPERWLMRPMPFARMLQAAAIEPDDVVLDVGCGTGYSTAVMARLANAVVALEEDEALARTATTTLSETGVSNAAVVTGPLTAGYPSEGPYDVIVLEGAVDEVPQTLLAQLRDGGRLVAVVGRGGAAAAMLYRAAAGSTSGRSLFNVAVPPLPGFARPKTFVF